MSSLSSRDERELKYQAGQDLVNVDTVLQEIDVGF